MTRGGFDSFLGKRERLVVTALSLAAAVRVFIFAAGFPIFNNVDELSHFDLVHKYARGQLPQQCLPPYDPGAVEIMAAYHTPEYVNDPDALPGGRFPPPFWRLPLEDAASAVQKRKELLGRIGNIESCSPPLYYAVAGFWYDLGKLVGIRGGRLVYWVRFLNVPNMAALVWLAYLFAKPISRTIASRESRSLCSSRRFPRIPFSRSAPMSYLRCSWDFHCSCSSISVWKRRGDGSMG